MAERSVPPPSVALLGTGIMGAGMGRSMLRAGLPLTVWNRTRAKAGTLAADGASVAATPAEAVAGADVVVTMLADADAVAGVMQAAAGGLRRRQVWAQTSTVGVAGLDRLARFAAENELIFLDCPVLGTRAPAEQGALTVFAAGPVEARPLVQPVFDAIGSKTLWLGEPGSATKLKLVVNSWVLTVTTGVAEAISLAEGLGADPRLFLQTISGGPLDCPYLQTKARAILDGDLSPNFTVEMAGKDARLITDAAAAADVRLDVAPAVAARFARATELGHGQQDMAATYFASRT